MKEYGLEERRNRMSEEKGRENGRRKGKKEERNKKNAEKMGTLTHRQRV